MSHPSFYAVVARSIVLLRLLRSNVPHIWNRSSSFSSCHYTCQFGNVISSSSSSFFFSLSIVYSIEGGRRSLPLFPPPAKSIAYSVEMCPLDSVSLLLKWSVRPSSVRSSAISDGNQECERAKLESVMVKDRNGQSHSHTHANENL